MADTQTTWILKLADLITAPMKAITKAITGGKDAVDDMSGAVKLSEKATKDALGKAKQYYKDLSKQIKDTEKKVAELEKISAKTAPGTVQAKAVRELNRAKKGLEELRGALKGADKDMKDLTDDLDKFKVRASRWEGTITAFNQMQQLADRVVQMLDFAPAIQDLQTDIQRFSSATGDELEELTRRAHRLGKVFNEDDREIAQAANAVSKQMGISFNDAFNLIEKGFKKGANLNDDMLQQLREYGPQMRAAGLSAAETMSLMVQAGKSGVFSDKALDSIKEANLSLKEMNSSQITALKGIKLSPKDFVGKSSFEAVQLIARQMEGASTQARQQVMKTIFKAAGEDAGNEFIKGLGSVDLDFEKLPEVQQANEGIKSWLADIETWFATTFGGFTQYFQTFATMATGIASTIMIMDTLRKVTWAQTLMQWKLNIATYSFPGVWIVLAIAAVVGRIIYAWKKFEGFRGFLYGLWGSIKQIFTNIGNLFKDVFSPIAEVIAAIQKGDWMGAAKAFLKLNPISMAARTIAASTHLFDGVGDAYKRDKQKGIADFRAEKEEEKKKKELSPDAYARQNEGNNMDGDIKPPKGKGDADGLSVGGHGGSKIITLNMDFKNYFNNISSKLDVAKIADELAGHVNDRLRDAALQL